MYVLAAIRWHPHQIYYIKTSPEMFLYIVRHHHPEGMMMSYYVKNVGVPSYRGRKKKPDTFTLGPPLGFLMYVVNVYLNTPFGGCLNKRLH